MVFFSYWTKRKSPAGDQFWKFSHQCSIFGRIGDQWVAISSPGMSPGRRLLGIRAGNL